MYWLLSHKFCLLLFYYRVMLAQSVVMRQ